MPLNKCWLVFFMFSYLFGGVLTFGNQNKNQMVSSHQCFFRQSKWWKVELRMFYKTDVLRCSTGWKLLNLASFDFTCWTVEEERVGTTKKKRGIISAPQFVGGSIPSHQTEIDVPPCVFYPHSFEGLRCFVVVDCHQLVLVRGNLIHPMTRS